MVSTVGLTKTETVKLSKHPIQIISQTDSDVKRIQMPEPSSLNKFRQNFNTEM